MKVIIDISRLHRKAFKRGIGIYALKLYENLCSLGDNNQYYLKKTKNDNEKGDIIHFPYFDLYFLTIPFNEKTPFIVTIHDLTPLKFPRHYPSGLKGKINFQIQKFLLKKTNAIITDSKNSKKDIINILKIPSYKIHVVYLAASSNFKKLSNVKTNLKLPQKFILYVGDINWNKNLPGSIKAFKNIKSKFKDLKFVLVGSAFLNNQLAETKNLKRLIKKLNLSKEIQFLGHLPEKELVNVYNKALVYIQPSFYEGFGLPVLEALSCSCPVLSSNKSSLKEVGENAVEYFDPYKKGQLEKKITFLLGNEDKLRELRNKSTIQAKKFSWKKTAINTKKVYQKVLKND